MKQSYRCCARGNAKEKERKGKERIGKDRTGRVSTFFTNELCSRQIIVLAGCMARESSDWGIFEW